MREETLNEEVLKPNRALRPPLEQAKTHRTVRRSARLRERNSSEEVSKPNKSLRPPLEQAKTRASQRLKQLQPKRKKIRCQKGLSILYYLGYHLWSLLTSIGNNTNIHRGQPPQKIGAEEAPHCINHPRNKSIEILLSACAQLAGKEELLPSSARLFGLRRESLPTTEIAPSNESRYRGRHFRLSLGKRNIYIVNGELPTELITRAKRIISQPYDSSEMDDATALGLERILMSIDPENEDIVIRE